MNTSKRKQAQQSSPINITVIGIGGAGCNMVNNMIENNIGQDSVHFVSCNTDVQHLSTCSPKSQHIQIGPKTTKGLGAGANPNRGQEAAQESIEEITDTFSNAHMLFICAGGGGGTGSGGAPEIARVAREKGILTVGFITKPFLFEGSKRLKSAEESIKKLQNEVDCLIIVNNQNLMGLNPKMSVEEGFSKVNEVLSYGVGGIVNIISRNGTVNVDFQDALRVMKNRMSRVVFGVGIAKGDSAGTEAAEIALSNPLLELDQDTLASVDTALISITGGTDLPLQTIQDAAEYLRAQIKADDDNLIVGINIIPEMKDTVEVCIFASCPKTSMEQLNPSKDLADLLNKAEAFVSTTATDEYGVDNLAIGKPHLDLQETGSSFGSSKQTKKRPSFLNSLLGKNKKQNWF